MTFKEDTNKLINDYKFHIKHNNQLTLIYISHDIKATIKAYEGFVEFLEHSINPKYCGCDRCPSCRIMQRNMVNELKECITKLKEVLK